MSNAVRHVLLLVVAGAPPPTPLAEAEESKVEVFTLTEDNADQALEKIFAADAVSVWGAIEK